MGKGGDSSVNTTSTAKKQQLLTWEQVKQHNTPDNAWIVHSNKVYDVSNWHEHPGGGVIFTHAGDDMTDIFAAFHAAGSHQMLKRFYIGDIDLTKPGSSQDTAVSKTPHQLAFEKGYRDLRSKMIVMGLFKTNGWFYVYKVLSTWMIWATATAMVYYNPDSTAWQLASAVVMGMFFQQSGWLAHDFLHHQVFPQRKYGDWMGIMIGNLWQGFSVQWWKNKHNSHHAVPNLHSSSALSQDGDPDIDTMPLLAWSLHQAQQFRQLNKNGKDSPVVQFLIRHQALFYFPILLLARLSWLNESFKTTYGLGASTKNAELELKHKGLQYPVGEKVATAMHYAWMFTVSSGFGRNSVGFSILYFLIATASCGWFLATVFGLGHNGMATYSAAERPDFWKLQVTTTRNITGGHGFPQFFVDWFCGGLQYQVDHHLFPTLPRHNLKRAHDLIESFCREWKVHYHETDLVDGNIEVLQHLSDVSNEFLLDFVRDGPTM